MKSTKFIKITTNHTDLELREMASSLSSDEVDAIEIFQDNFKCVEFADESGFQCMYIMIDEKHITELLSFYVRLSVNFSFEDISKDVLFGKVPTVDDELVELTNTFIDNNLDIDMVLDKILEMGKESLNEKDLFVLTK